MAYTTIDKPTDYFNTVLWTGNGADDRNITGVGFQPDLVWLKERTNTSFHLLANSIIGATPHLFSNENLAEITDTTNRLQAFQSDGFQVGSDGTVNQNSETYVEWNWLAGGTESSNTDGSITSSVSANTTAGFSIVSWTGTEASATVGHGLGVTPDVMILKNRVDAVDWIVYHSALDSSPEDYFLRLNEANAKGASSTTFDATAPTSTVFSVGNNSNTNGSSDGMIAYCFAEKKGYSKTGSYTGNGNSDGTFVYTGFKPAVIIAKLSSGVSDWRIYDNKRLGYNVDNNPIRINDSRAEETDDNIDFLSNGFKWRTTDGALNGSGSTYIYMAFADSPFVSSTKIPTTAR